MEPKNTESQLNCPSCNFENNSGSSYCGRCRMSFRPGNLFTIRVRDHLYWVLRRANAGFVSGAVAWFFVPILSGALSLYSSDRLSFVFEGLLGGAFLGTIDGMIEESNSKSLRGALFGGIGGALGGIVFSFLSPHLGPDQVAYGIFLFWAIAGSFIGMVSAFWERKPFKRFVGVVAGFLGGGFGGQLAITSYAFLLRTYPTDHWFVEKTYQVFTGGLLGVTLWFSLGLAERFVIFARKPLGESNFKPCDYCDSKNPLSVWYCEKCGSVLQFAAEATKLKLSEYKTLDRVQNMFQFLSRLSATTGVVASIVIGGIYILSPIKALISVVLVAGASYSFLILFSGLSESLRIYMKR